MTLWITAIALFSASGLMGGLNYVTTILTMRTRGLSMMRLPLTQWSLLITSVLGLLAFPVLLGAGILLSRLSGLVRQKIFAHYLGNSDAAGVFSAAYRIPNFLQNLFGEGVLSASFIPVYARLLAEEDEQTAGRVAGIIASLLALTVAILVLLGVLLTP